MTDVDYFCSTVLSGRLTNYAIGVVFFDKAVEGRLLRMTALNSSIHTSLYRFPMPSPDIKLLSIVGELFLQFGGLN